MKLSGLFGLFIRLELILQFHKLYTIIFRTHRNIHRHRRNAHVDVQRMPNLSRVNSTMNDSILMTLRIKVTSSIVQRLLISENESCSTFSCSVLGILYSEKELETQILSSSSLRDGEHDAYPWFIQGPREDPEASEYS